jgi:hypothetical protein
MLLLKQENRIGRVTTAIDAFAVGMILKGLPLIPAIHIEESIVAVTSQLTSESVETRMKLTWAETLLSRAAS